MVAMATRDNKVNINDNCETIVFICLIVCFHINSCLYPEDGAQASEGRAARKDTMTTKSYDVK